MSVMPGVDTSTTRTSVPLTNEYPLARVDLLPPEIIAGRKFARARGWMVVAVVGTVGLTGAAFFVADARADEAATQLAATQARTTELDAEAAQYDDVPATLAAVDRAETALETAMVTDVEWYRYLSQLGSVTPEGVWFTSVTFTGTPPGGQAVVSGDPLAPTDAVGDVITVGKALTYTDVAAWMDNVSSVTGLDHVLFSTAALTTVDVPEPFVDFQVSAKVLPEAYSDRFLSEAD